MEEKKKQDDKELILCIDDDATTLKVLEITFEKYGYNSLMIKDAYTGLNQFKEKKDKLAIVLLDIQIPKVDGFTLCKQMRESGFEKTIIAITAYPADNEYFQKDYIKAGFTDYVQKPFNNLIDILNKYVNS